MGFNWLRCAAVLLLLQSAAVSCLFIENGYSHVAEMEGEGRYRLFWKQEGDTLELYVEVKATGWFGIGFSHKGSMIGADIAIGWIDNDGRQHLVDYFGTDNAYPVKDEQQDFELLMMRKNGTHFLCSFRRKLKTCDEFDHEITDDMVRVIWALGDDIPRSDLSVNKHLGGDNGVKMLHLFEDKASKNIRVPAMEEYSSEITTVDMRIEETDIPDDDDTLYMCKVFKRPPGGKKHLIRFDALVDEEEKPYVHHIVIFRCPHDMSKWVDHPAVNCHTNRKKQELHEMYSCAAGPFPITWVVGNPESYLFEDNMAIPLFDGHEEHYSIEVHLDNRGLHKGKTSRAGLRLFLAEGSEMRPIEIGTTTLAVQYGPMYIVVPPSLPHFQIYGICSADCTKHIPAEGIYLRGGMLHSHVGYKHRLRHFRNGKELPPIIEDNNYDFNFQIWRFPEEPRLILPGDELAVECEYRPKPYVRYGGFGTKDEMCSAILQYYPKHDDVPLWCLSYPEPTRLYKLLGDDVVKTYAQSMIIEDNKGMNWSAIPWLESDRPDYKRLANDKERAQAFQTAVRDTTHTVSCTLDPRREYAHENRVAEMEGIEVSAKEDGYTSYGNEGVLSYYDGYPTTDYEPPALCEGEIQQNQSDGAVRIGFSGLALLILGIAWLGRNAY